MKKYVIQFVAVILGLAMNVAYAINDGLSKKSINKSSLNFMIKQSTKKMLTLLKNI